MYRRAIFPVSTAPSSNREQKKENKDDMGKGRPEGDFSAKNVSDNDNRLFRSGPDE